jgi:hypothetical protein
MFKLPIESALNAGSLVNQPWDGASKSRACEVKCQDTDGIE